MPDTIVLISGETEAPYLSEALIRHRPALAVRHASDSETLRQAMNVASGRVRLIAFSTNLIVPRDIIEALSGPAYNFHPGTPEYPGSMAPGFAIYEGADSFGVTVHEIAPEVDAGRIVFVRRFPIMEGTTGADLQGLTYQQLIETFFEFAERLACDDAPLPTIDETWRLPARTRAEAASLRRGSDELDDTERDRRRRAFGPPEI